MRLFWRVVLVPALLLGAACIDSKGRFDQFSTRLKAKQARDLQRELEAGAGELEAGTCVPITAEALTGKYYFALRSLVAPTKPILALMTLTAKGKAPKITADLVLEPVAASDGKTPSGVKNKAMMQLQGDAFTVASFPVLLPAKANPVLSDTDIKATMALAGSVCWNGEDKLEFVCGNITGMISEPLEVNLKGSTFGAVRITDGEPWPTFRTSCTDEGMQP